MNKNSSHEIRVTKLQKLPKHQKIRPNSSEGGSFLSFCYPRESSHLCYPLWWAIETFRNKCLKCKFFWRCSQSLPLYDAFGRFFCACVYLYLNIYVCGCSEKAKQTEPSKKWIIYEWKLIYNLWSPWIDQLLKHTQIFSVLVYNVYH